MLKARTGGTGVVAGATTGAQRTSPMGVNGRTSPMGVNGRTSPMGARAAVNTSVAQVQPAVEPVNTQQGVNLPATQQGGAIAARNDINIAEINAGILEGLDGIGDSNRVGIDGTEFEYKSSGRRERELNIVVNYGRKVYQFWDENSSLCQSFDGKTSTDGLVCATCEHKRAKECKFKFEIRWLELDEEAGEPVEFILTLPTVSAIEFVNYIKALAKEGLAVNQVVTNMKIERRQKDNNKYSAVLFECAGEAPMQG
jgi:hypothetical protein